MDPGSDKSIVHGYEQSLYSYWKPQHLNSSRIISLNQANITSRSDDSSSGRKITNSEETLRLQRERLCLFARDSECPSPMLTHMMGSSGISIKENRGRKLREVKSAISKVEK